jgi:nucleoside-diphosphate-sugar epimerase
MSKILLTGATGYIGGTVLSQLLANASPSIKDLTIDLLIRDDAYGVELRKVYGSRITTIKWPGLEYPSFIRDVASNYDIVINTGCGFIPEGAIAFVHGLARNVKPGRPAPWMLHISGCTNLSDCPLTQPSEVPPREWNDERDNAELFEHLKALEISQSYPQRTTEVGVLEAAASTGVQAVSVNTPCVFGRGTGLFNQQGVVIPSIMKWVLQHGCGWKLNETANFDWVHVIDLADVYVLLVRTILERKDRAIGYIPNGILFAAVGRTLIKDINQRCLDVAFAASILPRGDTPQRKEIRAEKLERIAAELTAGRLDVAERGWAGTKATKASLARKLLGWDPAKTEDAWVKEFDDVLVTMTANSSTVTMESCIGVSSL